MSAIRWGILGTGRMAAQYAADLKRVEGAELAAVASRSKASAEAFAQRFDIPVTCEGYQCLVERDDIDVVYVATPPSVHRENSLAALRNGKAVLCEKPFALNAAEAQELIETARARELFLMEAMWTRYVPAVVRLRELMAEQVIGQIQLMLAGGAYIPEFDPQFYLFNRELGGGVLLDAGVYLVSMASMLFGPPTSIHAMGELGSTGVDEHEAILLHHAGGVIANLYVSLRARASPDLSLLGERGTIYLYPPIFCPRRIGVTTDAGEEVIELPFEGGGYQFQAIEVGRCLRTGRTESAVMPLDETLQIMTTMDRIRAQLGVSYPAD